MNNNENNGLNMNQPMSEKEYWVTKLEKYEELNEQKKLDILKGCAIAICAIVSIGIASSNIVVNSDEYISSSLVDVVGSGAGFISFAYVACSIAKKAGLESRINAIKEKLELYDIQNNQNNDNEEEKGRNR